LRESIQGPACVGEDGKVVDEVFLVTTDEESDRCAKLGLKKDKVVAITGNFVDEKVPAELDISLENQQSNLDLVESSCTEARAVAFWFVGKFVWMWLSLANSCLKPAFTQCKKSGNCLDFSAAGFWTILGFVIALHPPLPIFLASGCTMYRRLYVYEVASTLLDLSLFIRYQFCGEGSNFGYVSMIMTIGIPFSLYFDVSGLLDEKICPLLLFQWAKLVLTCCAFCAKVYVWRLNCNGSSVDSESGNGVVESSLAYSMPAVQLQRYSTGGQPIARF